MKSKYTNTQKKRDKGYNSTPFNGFVKDFKNSKVKWTPVPFGLIVKL